MVKVKLSVFGWGGGGGLVNLGFLEGASDAPLLPKKKQTLVRELLFIAAIK